MSTLAEMVVRIGADATRLKSGLAAASRDVQGFQTRTRAAGDAMTSFGKSSMKGGLLLGAGLAYAIKTGADFDHTMSTVKAATGARAQDFATLRTAALKYGAASQFSSQQVAEAMVEMGKAGFKTKETLSALPGVLSAAAASGETMATVSNIMVNTLTGFGLAAGNSTKISDALAFSANETTASIADFGEALKYVAPVAKSAGVSFDETNGALIALAKVGIQGSMAGTNLRGVLQSMIAPNKRVTAAMKDMHLSFRDAKGEMRPLATNIDTLKRALAGMDKGKADQFLARMFGRENIAAAQAFLDIGGAGLRKFADESEHSKGAAAKFAATLRDNLSGDMENFSGSIETAAIHLSDQLSPSLRKIVQDLNGLVNGFNTMSPAMQGLVAKILAVSAAFLVFAGVFGIVGGAVLKGVSMMSPLVTVVAAVGRAVAAAALQLAIAIPEFEALGLAVASTNPILLGIVAVAAAAGAAYLLLKGHTDDVTVSHKQLAAAAQQAKTAIDSIHPDNLSMREAAIGVQLAKSSLQQMKTQLQGMTPGTAAYRDQLLQVRAAALNVERSQVTAADATKKYHSTITAAGSAIDKQSGQLAKLKAEHDKLIAVKKDYSKVTMQDIQMYGPAQQILKDNAKQLADNEGKQAKLNATLKASSGALASLKGMKGAAADVAALSKQIQKVTNPPKMKPFDTTIFMSSIQKMIAKTGSMPGPMSSNANAAGMSVGQGVANGITASSPAAYAAADQLAEGVIARIKKAHETASPSKRAAREIGVPIAEGMALGMRKGSKKAVDAAAWLAQQVMGTAANDITSEGIGAAQAAANAAQRIVDAAQAKADAANLRKGVRDARKTKGKGDDIDAAQAIKMARLQSAAAAAQKKVDALSNAVAHFTTVDQLAAASYNLSVSLGGGTATLAQQKTRITELGAEYAKLAAYLKANAKKLGADARSNILNTLQGLNDEINSIKDAVAHAAENQANTLIQNASSANSLVDAQYALSVALNGGTASAAQQSARLAQLAAEYASLQDLMTHTPLTPDQTTQLLQALTGVQNEMNSINNDISQSATTQMQELLDREKARADAAEAALKLSQAQYGALNGPGDIGTGGADTAAAAGTTIIVNSLTGFDPRLQQVVAGVVNTGNATGANADRLYDGTVASGV